jgi:hypothetical protein
MVCQSTPRLDEGVEPFALEDGHCLLIAIPEPIE